MDSPEDRYAGITVILLAVRIWQAAGHPATSPAPQPAAEPVSAI